MIVAARCLLLLLLSLLWLPAGAAVAEEALVLHAGEQSYAVNRYVGVLEDPGSTLSLQQAMASSAFAYPHKAETNFGFSTSSYWAHFDLINHQSAVSDWFLEYQYPMIDLVEVFIVHPDGRIERSISGDMVPFSQRALKHRYPMFKITMAQDEQVSIYLRIRSEGALQMPLLIRSQGALMARDHNEQFLLGIYYGILLAMFIYNTMLYLSVRDPNYLFYSLYIGAWTMMQLAINGLAFEYLWPQSPYWANTAVPLLVGIIVLTTAQFASSFLEVQRYHPRLYTVFRAYMALGVAVVIGAFLIRYGTIIKIAQAGALTECVFAFAAGVLCLRRGGIQARYFMLAWSMLLVGGALYVMQNSGIISTVFVTEYGLQVGSAVEVLLFSFALAHRMKLLQDENARIEREATEQLERRVQQRTEELDGALANLSDAHQRLKDLSRIDGLTGVKNRAYFTEKVGIEWLRGLREKQALGILMIDIDHFKKVNDTFGHLGGDICLKEVAHTLAFKIHRVTDDVFRFGGEEFIVMLPNTDLAGALHLAEVMRRAIESIGVVMDGSKVPLTVSIGVACMVPAAGATAEQLVARADKALYDAKNSGRNRVCSAGAADVPALPA